MTYSPHSKFGVCKKALSFLSDDYPLPSFDDDTAQARYCNVNFQVACDLVLKFAYTEAMIVDDELESFSVVLNDDVYPPVASRYKYRIPRKYLNVLVPETVSVGEEGPHVLHGLDHLSSTSPPPLRVKCVQRSSDLSECHPLVIDAIAARLAWQIAYGLTGNIEEVSKAREIYFKAIDEVRASGVTALKPKD